MGTETLTMKIGSNTGLLLTNIAREKLLYDFDYKGAKRVLTNSLMGFTDNYAKQVIIGKMHLIVDGQTLSLIDPQENEDKELYPKELDLEKWKINLIDDIISLSQRFRKILLGRMLRARLDFNTLKSIKVEISKQSLLSLALNDDIDDIINDVRFNADVDNYISTIKVIEKFYNRTLKLTKLFFELKQDKLIQRAYIPTIFTEFAIQFKAHLDNKKINLYVAEDTYNNVKSYVENEMRLQKEIDEKLIPVKITDLWDAGWLAPNGDFYGMNGDIANMLHDKLAERLLKEGIIKKSDVDSYYSGNANGWLRANGWIAVHHQTVHSDIPSLRRAGLLKGNLHLTKTQQKALSEYAKELGQPLKFCGMKSVKPEKIMQYDILQFEKLFDFI